MSEALNNSSAAEKMFYGSSVKFRDAKLQRHVEQAYAHMTSLPKDLLPICGLLDAYQWFTLTDGEDLALVQEAIEHLLSPELRPALRQWYSHFGSTMNPAATEFRDRLSKMAGEKFG